MVKNLNRMVYGGGGGGGPVKPEGCLNNPRLPAELIPTPGTIELGCELLDEISSGVLYLLVIFGLSLYGSEPR